MAAYFLFDNVEVHDRQALAEYAQQASKLVRSPAYQPLKALRRRAVRNDAVLIAG